VPVTTALGKLDTEVTTSDKQTKNLILVGGPAVNSLVAELGNAGKHMTLEEYRAEGEGFAIIDYIEDAFATGKAALVVAGHSAEDTRTAANILQNYDTKGLSGSEVRSQLQLNKVVVSRTRFCIFNFPFFFSSFI